MNNQPRFTVAKVSPFCTACPSEIYCRPLAKMSLFIEVHAVDCTDTMNYSISNPAAQVQHVISAPAMGPDRVLSS